MTDSPQKTIDFTPMYASHDAFRRDLERLATAVAEGQAGSPQVRAGWENFKRQLHIHHTTEDGGLWPRVRERAAGRPATSPCWTTWRPNTPASTRCSRRSTPHWPTVRPNFRISYGR